jgi:hypothetical protein
MMGSSASKAGQLKRCKLVTKRQMLRWIRAYEKHYFNGERLALGIETKHALPQMACLGLFSVIEISNDVLCSEKIVRILLLHELVHSKLFLQAHTRDEKVEQGHGPRFRAEIKRLVSAGAYDRLL